MNAAPLFFVFGWMLALASVDSLRATEPALKATLKLSFRLMGGEVEVSGESADVLAKDGTLMMTCHQLDLGELVKFVDSSQAWVTKTDGRVQGQIALRLKGGELAGLGPGRIELVPGSVAKLTLCPVPGLFSMYMPEKVRKVYPGLDALEAGRTPLIASVLRLEIPHEVDPQGRLGWLKIEGRPDDAKLVAPLSMEMNFRGEVVEAVREFLKLKLRLGG